MSTETQPFTVTPEQRRQLRKDLVAALRSGEFKQCMGHMCRGGRHCVLGVACRVFDKMFPGNLAIQQSKGLPNTLMFDGETWTLPRVVVDSFGFRFCDASYGHSSLFEENDCGMTFDQLADLIESNPPGLWVDEPEVANA